VTRTGRWTRRTRASWRGAALVACAALAACTRHASSTGSDASGGTPAPTASVTTTAVALATTATTAQPAPVAVDLPADFPRGFPQPPGGIVTEATATRDEGSIQADGVVDSQLPPDRLFAWYEQALGKAGWNIDHEGREGGEQKLHAVHGDSEADVSVGPDEDNAGWTAATLSIYWAEPSAAGAAAGGPRKEGA